MKVNGSSDVGSASPSRSARRASADSFSLGPADRAPEAAPAARAGATSGIASLDALLALQDVGGPLERRRRAVSRAGRILDVLDEVKVALLDGEVSPDALRRLTAAVRDQRENTEDSRLESVLDEIETRAAVEMAKLEAARAAV